MVEIRGKRGRKVPMILTPEVKESIDLLNKTRKSVKTRSFLPDQADSRWRTWEHGIACGNLLQSVNHLSQTPQI